MQCERLTAILLVNVLVIQAARIPPTSKTLLDEKLSENGFLYNTNSSHKGPLSSQIFEIHPRLSFLGSYNSKSWYIERTPVAYKEAVSGCTNMGMVLAKANQAELNFLYSVTSGSDDYSWLGATAYMSLTSFRWNTDNSTPTGIRFRSIDTVATLGFVLDRWSGTSGVLVLPTDSLQYYICSI